jgi:uncharacterized protein (DUF2267 family)
MTNEQFINEVARQAGVSKQQAEPLMKAVLSALADRLTGGEADDVASQLPKGIKEAMIPSTPEAETFGLGEFIERIARRAGVTTEQAEVGARAVMKTLREAITEGEFKDMTAQLPEDFGQLVEQAPSRA